MTTLSLKDFDFAFPENLVAHEPLEQRDASRLLIWDSNHGCRHSVIRDLADELPEGSLVILNDSRVFPSRIFAETAHGGRVEIMLLEPKTEQPSDAACDWQAIGRPMRKLRAGTQIRLGGELSCTVIEVTQSTADDLVPFSVRFPLALENLMLWLETNGYIPLPPYIKRDNPKPASESHDAARYQTIYSNQTGSVAAPTAGLHLTPAIMESFAKKNIDVVPVTLHVGGGTFLPVRASDVGQHRMHEERFKVSSESYHKWLRARREGRKIVAIGTTAFRCFESLLIAASDKRVDAETLCNQWHRTSLFIWPKSAEDRYRPQTIDGLVTNFHQPQSTLFMLISSLLGIETAKAIYKEAFEASYRLFSYGDANLYWLGR